MSNLSQHDTILLAMLNNRDIEWWNAVDFQQGKYFVGYEATARMSELAFKYPMLIKRGKVGRFRVIGINWEDEKEVKEQKERIEILLKD